jgi:hypothetical protein
MVKEVHSLKVKLLEGEGQYSSLCRTIQHCRDSHLTLSRGSNFCSVFEVERSYYVITINFELTVLSQEDANILK